MSCKRPSIKLSVILLAGLLLSACGVIGGQPASEEPITIGYGRWPGYGAMYIADERGFFEEEGAPVRVIALGTYDNVVADISSGELDGAALVSIDVLRIAASGRPLQAVWAWDTSIGGDVLVASSDVAGVEDLVGRRVAYAFGSFGHLFVAIGLENYGLTEAGITHVDIGGEGTADALAAGEVDAGHTWDPHVTRIVQSGGQILFTSEETPGLIVDHLVFQSEIVEQRPDDIQAIVSALARAVDFWQENPEEGNAIVAQALGAPVEEIPAFLLGDRIYTLEDNLVAFDPATADSWSLYRNAEVVSEFLVSREIVDQAPDIEAIINPTFVQALSEE